MTFDPTQNRVPTCLLTADELAAGTLHALLICDPSTGKLFWRERGPEWFVGGNQPPEWSSRKWNTRRAGEEAFTAISAHGYKKGRIMKKGYLAHRVIFCMVTGAWPEADLDHINQDKLDNRFINLRAVSHAENMRNVKMISTNTSGHVGVIQCKRTGNWRAQIASKNLGVFASKEDAIKARQEAAVQHGFSPLHGLATEAAARAHAMAMVGLKAEGV